MDRLEHPSIRWGIAFVFLGVELLLFVVAADLPLADQIVAVGISIILFILLPSILKDVSEKGAAPVESTQQRRASWVAGAVDRAAVAFRLGTIAPVVSWLTAAFLVAVAGGTATEDTYDIGLRMISATGIYLALAAFAAPPVRRYLQGKLPVALSRPVVVAVLAIGVLVNEEIVAPSVASSAALVF